MFRTINLKRIGSKDDGYLSFFEGNSDIPFEIKRIYYIYEVQKGVKRGMHAHKRLQQILWCPYGEIKVVLDDGKTKVSCILDTPEKALIISSGIWREITWEKENSVLCVGASDYYSESDYIRSYKEFLEYVKKGFWRSDEVSS